MTDLPQSDAPGALLLHEPRCAPGRMRGHRWSSCRQTDMGARMCVLKYKEAVSLKDEPCEFHKLTEDLQRGEAANLQRSPPEAFSLQQL